MPRSLAIALLIGLPLALIAIYVVALRDPRFTPSPLYKVLAPVLLGLLLVASLAIVVFPDM